MIIVISLTPQKRNILAFLAKKGPSTGYDMIKTKGFTAKVYTYLSELDELGFVTVFSQEESGRGRIRYALTELGVCEVLKISKQILRTTQTLVLSHPDAFPLVLGVWHIFDGIDEDLVSDAINRAAWEITNWRYVPELQMVPERYSRTEEEAFTYTFYWSLLYRGKEQCQEIMTKVSESRLEELRSYLLSLLEYHIDTWNTWIGGFEKSLAILKE